MKRKDFYIVFSIILVVVLAAAGGLFYWNEIYKPAARGAAMASCLNEAKDGKRSYDQVKVVVDICMRTKGY